MSSLNMLCDFIITNKHEYNRFVDMITKGKDRDKFKDDILRGLFLIACMEEDKDD